MILNNNRKLIGDLTVFASMTLNNVAIVIHLLTFDFKLALFAVVFEVDEEGDDASEKHRGHSSTSDARCLKHYARSCG